MVYAAGKMTNSTSEFSVPLALIVLAGDGAFVPNVSQDPATVQVDGGTPAPSVWSYTPLGADPEQGGTLNLNGWYLTTGLVPLPERNDCLAATTIPGDAAQVLPVLLEDDAHFCLQLAGQPGTVLTLDTRGYVTQFEPLQPADGYPYWQRFATVAESAS